VRPSSNSRGGLGGRSERSSGSRGVRGCRRGCILDGNPLLLPFPHVRLARTLQQDFKFTSTSPSLPPCKVSENSTAGFQIYIRRIPLLTTLTAFSVGSEPSIDGQRLVARRCQA